MQCCDVLRRGSAGLWRGRPDGVIRYQFWYRCHSRPVQHPTPRPTPTGHRYSRKKKDLIGFKDSIKVKLLLHTRIPLLLRSRAESSCSCWRGQDSDQSWALCSGPSVTWRGNICGTCQNFANQSALKQIGRLWKVGGQRSAASWLNMQLQASSYLPKSQDGHKNANYLIERRESDWFISIRSANLVGKGLDLISF